MKKNQKRFEVYFFSFPDASLVWSDILSRTFWLGLPSTPVVLESMSRKGSRINQCGHNNVCSLPHGRFIRHAMPIGIPGLLDNEGTHLIPIWNDIFLHALQEALQLFIASSVNKYNARQ